MFDGYSQRPGSPPQGYGYGQPPAMAPTDSGYWITATNNSIQQNNSLPPMHGAGCAATVMGRGGDTTSRRGLK
jgi:hypothetical protein